MTRPAVLFSLVLCAVLVQMALQLATVPGSESADWPYEWDENRYYCYATDYYLAFQQGGISDALNKYHERPPYSLTLLLTSIPFLPFLEHFPNALRYHMLLYVIVLDAAVVAIARWQTNTWRAGAAALAVVHFSTRDIFSQSYSLVIAEALKYQVGLATSVLPLAILAVLLAGLPRRPKLSAAFLGVLLVGMLSVRPPALPYFIGVSLLPAAGLIGIALWYKQRGCRLADPLFLAAMLSLLLSSLHWIKILPFAYQYLLAVRNDFCPPMSLASLLPYYFRGCVSLSWLFPIAVGVLVVTAPREICRVWTHFRRYRPRGFWRLLPTMKALLVAWSLLMSYALPTIMRAQDSLLGFFFCALVLTMAVGSLFQIQKSWPTSFRGTRMDRTWKLDARETVLTLALLSVPFLAFAYQSRVEIHRLLTRNTPEAPVRIKAIRQVLCSQIIQFVENWSKNGLRDRVVISVYGKGLDFPSQHTFSTIPASCRKPSTPIYYLRPHGWPHGVILEQDIAAGRFAEVVFVPEFSAKDTRLCTVFKKWTDDEIDEATGRKLLESHGYIYSGELSVVPGLRLHAYTIEQISRAPNHTWP